uniref:Uncharacterized protein n=1 Tax=Amphimedon queenslandica TaxID=400682 RepID=A0A1X7SH72_AMPQE
MPNQMKALSLLFKMIPQYVENSLGRGLVHLK